MLTEKDLRELVATYGENNGPVVSLYLNTELGRYQIDQYRLNLRQLLKQIANEISAEDAERIERYLDFEFDWEGKAMALFLSPTKGLRVYSLPVPVEDQVKVLPRPFIEPAKNALGKHGRYAVAVVAREGVRIFLFNAGQLEDAAGTFGPVPQRHKQGGTAATKYQRRADEAAERNLRDGVELLIKFLEETKCYKLLLAGTEENVSTFEELLPKAWKERIIGRFPISADASESEVLERSIKVVEQADEERKQRLVEEVITAAAKGDLGAIGLADTLAAVQDGRARSVVVADGFHADGYQCTQCGFMTVERVDVCGFCNGKMNYVPDAVDLLIHRALQDGLPVETVSGSEALEKAGKIGALLRY